MEKESALTNGSSCSSSVLSGGLETGLTELDEAARDCCVSFLVPGKNVPAELAPSLLLWWQL